jgi:PHD/YefM family antitoxin component YafN of YafNO toxin-antitoxin module
MKNQFITDTNGRKISVILPIEEYDKMMRQLEELEDIKAFDEAMKNEAEEISVHDAFREIESVRRELGR